MWWILKIKNKHFLEIGDRAAFEQILNFIFLDFGQVARHIHHKSREYVVCATTGIAGYSERFLVPANKTRI